MQAPPSESACLLQKANSVGKTLFYDQHQLDEIGSEAVAAVSYVNSIVALTYCDAGFRELWPLFHRCYTRATSCPAGRPCSMPDVQLVDLGMGEEGEGTGQHCTGTSLVQGTAGHDLPPPGVPPLILRGISRVLSQHQDVLRLDADAFLLQSPFELVQDTYPDADIISSADCAWHTGTTYCGWYREPSYLAAHDGGDPLSDRGFMLNTGLMYMRSTPVTVRLAELAELTVPTITSNEQIALNEALLQYSCQWTDESGRPISEDPEKAVNLLNSGPIFGSCSDGLRVVVLPWHIVTRAVGNFTGVVGFHPGGSKEYKLSTLPKVEAACSV